VLLVFPCHVVEVEGPKLGAVGVVRLVRGYFDSLRIDVTQTRLLGDDVRKDGLALGRLPRGKVRPRP